MFVPSDIAAKGNKGENGRVLVAAQDFTDSTLLKGREVTPLDSTQENRGSYTVMTLIVFQKSTFSCSYTNCQHFKSQSQQYKLQHFLNTRKA